MRTSVIVLTAVLGLSGCGGGAGKDQQPEVKQEPLTRIQTESEEKGKHEAVMAHHDFSLNNDDNEIKHPHHKDGDGSVSDGSDSHEGEQPKKKKSWSSRLFGSSKSSSSAGTENSDGGHHSEGAKKKGGISSWFRSKK